MHYHYATPLMQTALFQELSNRAVGSKMAELTELQAMIVAVAEEAGPLLKDIRTTFRQYTEHDLGHALNLTRLMGEFIPATTLPHLSSLEITLLILTALLHDFGMFVTDDERRGLNGSKDFRGFAAGDPARFALLRDATNAGAIGRQRAIEDSIIADYFRRLHPERALQNIRKYITTPLRFHDYPLMDTIGTLCESHGWGVYNAVRPREPEKQVQRLPVRAPIDGTPLNLQYVACCLRLSDILDFDRSRVPLSLLRTIGFTEEISVREWKKHLQIRSFDVTERDIQVFAECTSADHWVSVMDFLDVIELELTDCDRLIMKDRQVTTSDTYALHLPVKIDRRNVVMSDRSMVAGRFRFELSYERIMSVLMDRSLYPDPSLCIRELLQNSLDACRVQGAKAKAESQSYVPAIEIEDWSLDPVQPRVVVRDNGTGMSLHIVERYLMRVGESYYRSGEFAVLCETLEQSRVTVEATSQFGIGFLSVFMLADTIEIETKSDDDEDILHVAVTGPTKYFLIRRLPGRRDSSRGTAVTLHVRHGMRVDVQELVDRFAVDVECELKVLTSNGRVESVPAYRWQQTSFDIRDIPEALHSESIMDEEWALPPKTEPQWPGVTAELADLLVASSIDFEKMGFSDLRGSAWLWLLIGENGSPTPRRGQLRVGYKGIGCAPDSVAGMVGQLQRSYSYEELSKDDLASLFDGLERDAVPYIGEYVDSVSFSLPHDLHKRWKRLDKQQRAIFRKCVFSGRDYPGRWYSTKGIPEALIRDDSLPAKVIDYSDTIGIASPQQFALHGIYLPAGITLWNPDEAFARRVKLLNAPGGFRIDFRGRSAPTPVASRLFVDAQAGRDAAVLVARAFIRHAIGLTGERSIWKRWLRGFVRGAANLLFWPRALYEEHETLERSLGYVDQNGKTLTRHQVTKIGVSHQDSLETKSNAALLMCKSLDEHGTYDFDHVVEPAWATIEQWYMANSSDRQHRQQEVARGAARASDYQLRIDDFE